MVGKCSFLASVLFLARALRARGFDFRKGRINDAAVLPQPI